MKRINRLLFFVLILFIYINSVDASFSCNSNRETLTERAEASSAGFKANMPGCYHWEFTGNYDSIGPYLDFKTAADVANEFKKAYYSIDGKSYHATYVPMCTHADHDAYVTATVKCTAYFYTRSRHQTEAFKQDTANAEYITMDKPVDVKDVSSTSNPTTSNPVNCSSYDAASCPAGCSVQLETNNASPNGVKRVNQSVAIDMTGARCVGTFCSSGTLKDGTCYSCSSGSLQTISGSYKCVVCPSNHSYNSSTGKCTQTLNCPANYTWNSSSKKCVSNQKYCPTGYSDKDSNDVCYGPKYCAKDDYTYNSTLDKCEKYDCTNSAYTLSSNKRVCSATQTVQDYTRKEVIEFDELRIKNINTVCNLIADNIANDDETSGYTVIHDDCDCTITYNYACPVYKCPAEVQTIDTCTPKFKNDSGESVYCLNPSKPFSATYEKTAEYQVDESFNVRKCTSSHGTIECGYANILIEAKYHNKVARSEVISENAIELALRLWAVHTDRGGFNTFGLSNRRGLACDTSMWYMKWDNKITNVYEYTYKEMMKRFFKEMDSAIRGMDYVDANKTSTLNGLKIECVKSGKQPSDMLAVACGDGIVYRQAYALFFNTLVGNKDMQSHLSYLYNGELALPPEGAYYKTDEYGSYIEVTYNEDEFRKAFRLYEATDVEIDCDRLDTSNPHYNDIRPYCFTKVAMLNSSDAEIRPRTDSGKMSKCYYKDSSCRRYVSLVAICDITLDEERVTKIKVTTERKSSSYSIKQYVSCENPGVNQSMVAYGDFDLSKPIIPEESTDIFYVSSVNCKNVCNDFTIREDVKKECAKTGNVYGRVFSSSIKDPSLNCILNMKTSYGKELYDYTDYYKVNKSLCSIYCSDEVEYYIADKAKGVSGRTFKYDIEPRVNGTRLVAQPLTSMIKERRTCVSEIYYDNQIPDTSKLKQDYGLTQEEANKIKNFKDLYAFLKAKSDKEGGRPENINQIIYDLYNCNLYSQSVFTANGIQKPRGSLTGNLRESIKNQYSKSNNYGLVASNSDCEIDVEAGINTCIKEKDIQYNWGSEPDGTTVKINSVQTISSIFSKLTYCTGSECFVYDTTDDAGSYTYPKPTDASRANRLIGDNKAAQTGQPRAGEGTLRLTSASFKEWFGRNSIKIPVNDYVLFDITVDVDFYNASKYQSLPDTGKIINKGSRSGNFLTLDDYLYTISKNAYNMCDRVSDTISTCKIEQEFETVATFFRTTKNDNFISKVNSCNKFTCYVDVEPPCPILDGDISACTRYRNVDASNLFPRYENIPSNWATTEGAAAKTQIENTSELLKAKDLLEYRITLTPTQIKNIKDYNKNHSAYKLEPVIESTCTNVSNEYYINCKTEFMNLLRDDTTHKYGELDPDYRDGVSLYNRTLHP